MGRVDLTESVSEVFLSGRCLIHEHHSRCKAKSLMQNCISLPDSMLDGTPTLRMNDFVLGALSKGKITLELSENEQNPTPLKVEEVKFVTDRRIEEGVKKAEKGFAEVMGQHEVQVS